MSETISDKAAQKSNSRRSRRGGVKNATKHKSGLSLEGEVLKLMSVKESVHRFSNNATSFKETQPMSKFSKNKKRNEIRFTNGESTSEGSDHRDVSKAAKKKKTRNEQEQRNSDVDGDTLNYSKKDEAHNATKMRDRSKDNTSFPKHITKNVALKILKDQHSDNPLYFKGEIRINQTNINHAYLTVEDGFDILIRSVRDRNKALERDIVIVKLNPEEEWLPEGNHGMQKTGRVVGILEKVHSRKIIGTLQMHKGTLRMRPRDQRAPMLYIDPCSLPEQFSGSAESHKDVIFLASITMWLRPYNCFGKIEEVMGRVGDLEHETRAILYDNALDVTPYAKELYEHLPDESYVLTTDDLVGREDWREECVFTIDPATAVDLDDAVSCKVLPNGNYEIGVHISDVTHYLHAFTPLDEKVAERATTVYLVDNVYHMLPKQLCALCSLLPGQDKLSFSVIWEMTSDARVVKHRFAKSVVNSCYQMSYEKAQEIIENPQKLWTKEDLPGLKGKCTASQVCEVVNTLYKLSVQMTAKRYANGALSLHQPKLQIILDRTTGYPVSYKLEERQDSNRLIEEFMLLANMTVAKHLYDALPNTALLRAHGQPLKRVLDRTTEDLRRLGINLDTDSAGGLQASLLMYEKTGMQGSKQKFVTDCRMMVINALCAQSMPRANYLCSMSTKNVERFHHFALNVPFYTHFTSPIRRYADCIVHRLLFSCLTRTPLKSRWSPQLCAKIAANCNGRKYSAKIAQDKSNELYFINLLSRAGPTQTTAIVMKVTQHALNVLLCHLGKDVRLFFSDISKKAKVTFETEHSVPTITIKWEKLECVQVINVFSIVNLRIEKHPNSYSLRGVLLPPHGDCSINEE